MVMKIVGVGNVSVRNWEVVIAVEFYAKSLLLGDKEQEGVLLVMRGTALLQRAYICRFVGWFVSFSIRAAFLLLHVFIFLGYWPFFFEINLLIHIMHVFFL